MVKKHYTHNDLEPFNILRHPIYMFDLVNKCMWWANTSALQVWNADSLEELLHRDFTDMSPATLKRCNEYMDRLRRGEQFNDMWTIYPKGGKPVSFYGSFSGICNQDGQLVIVCEVELQKTRDHIDERALRGWEVLRHLPMAVSQFDAHARSLDNNPEALHVFGGSRNCSKCSCANNNTTNIHNPCPTQNHHDSTTGCYLLNRFVTPQDGARIWQQVFHQGLDFNGEIQQRTKDGIRWFAVQMRRTKDPVTGQSIVIYSARDIGLQIQAKNEAIAADKSRKQADEANMAKSEFVAVMAHEMRTPLHQVLGFLELLHETELTAQQQDYLELVETSASALMAVVNDLLDFTKLEAGKMTMESIPINTAEVALRTLKVIESKAQQKGLCMTADIDHSIPAVLGDPSRLRQVLLNFMGNAVKFTQRGSIQLSVQTKTVAANTDGNDDRVVIEFAVQDTGIGIHPDHQELIFNKYQQADAAVARKYGGTGLGLAICKIIVETQGGETGVDSQLGQGSRFWFRVPYAKVLTAKKKKQQKQPKTALCHSSPNGVSNSSSDVDDDSDRPAACRPLNILVAEDNKINQKLVMSILRRLGHQSKVVDNGRLAVEAVEKAKYDIVLMDVQMPHMDGMEATQVIRKNGWSQTDLPILGLTADFNKKNLDKFTNVGMNDCLGKPLKMDDLKAYLTVYTGQ